jgi:glutamate/aspartate transport system substrate-binding protein
MSRPVRGRLAAFRTQLYAGKALILCLVMLGMQAPCSAQSSTLDRIARRGYVVLGHREAELPFSYVVDGQVQGYSHEICMKVVEGLRHQLNRPQLAVRYVPVTTATRFILMGRGAIDLECGTNSNTAERRKLADFSLPHFVAAPRILSLRKHGWQTVRDLHGHSVVAATGSYSVEQLNAQARAGHLNIAVVLSRSYQEAFAKLSSGKVTAMVGDEALLAGLVASAPEPGHYQLSSSGISRAQPSALMLPPADPAFKALVNRILRQLYESREIDALYRRWFESPIPPAGVQLGLPMSDALRTIFRQPSRYQE